MSIEVAWDNPKRTVIRADFIGRWNWPEYHSAVKQLAMMVEENAQPVDVIFDLMRSAPVSASAPMHGDYTLRLLSEKVGIIVIVADNVFTKILVATFKQVYRKWSQKVLLTESLDEARRFIAPL